MSFKKKLCPGMFNIIKCNIIFKNVYVKLHIFEMRKYEKIWLQRFSGNIKKSNIQERNKRSVETSKCFANVLN